MTKLETEIILIEVRGPDDDTETLVFVDGEQVTDIAVVTFDAGQGGYDWAEWEEHVDECIATLPEAAGNAIVEMGLRDKPPGHEYITD